MPHKKQYFNKDKIFQLNNDSSQRVWVEFSDGRTDLDRIAHDNIDLLELKVVIPPACKLEKEIEAGLDQIQPHRPEAVSTPTAGGLEKRLCLKPDNKEHALYLRRQINDFLKNIGYTDVTHTMREASNKLLQR